MKILSVHYKKMEFSVVRDPPGYGCKDKCLYKDENGFCYVKHVKAKGHGGYHMRKVLNK